MSTLVQTPTRPLEGLNSPRLVPRPADAPRREPQQQPASIRGNVAYSHPPPPGEHELYQQVYKDAEGKMPGNITSDVREVDVYDLHSAPGPFSLHTNGFQLERLEVPEDINWDDDEDVKARYYPLISDLIKRAAGASSHIFDHTIRRGHIEDITQLQSGKGPKERTPVSRVHVDYNTRSGVGRLKELLPEQASQLQKRPFAVIQVWRPLKGPVVSSPLGMIDAATVDKNDYVDLRLQFEQRTGYNFALKYNPAHRWYYTSRQQADEAYVFKCYDSRADTARFTPHTGFVDPTTPPGAPQRESIEIRAYAFWDHLPEQPIAHKL